MNSSLEQILNRYAKAKESVFFVQIGSNDGIAGDPLHQFVKANQWAGICVEPIPYIYDQLVANYGPNNSRLMFENSAIGTFNGESTMFRLEKSENPGLPHWYEQLASFKKSVVMKHCDSIPNIERLIIQEKVVTITFETLLAKHKVQRVDLLHLDTEGFDWEILRNIDIAKFELEIIIYEHKHLDGSDYRQSLSMFKEVNFTTFACGGDTVAVKNCMVPRFTVKD